jgi:hypothetical protein
VSEITTGGGSHNLGQQQLQESANIPSSEPNAQEGGVANEIRAETSPKSEGVRENPQGNEEEGNSTINE